MNNNFIIRIGLCISFVIWLAPTAIAQPADAYLHDGPILIRNVTVIDGLGNLPAPMRDVLIIDGKIEKTSVHGMIGDIPENIRVIDGEGMTAMPGLIDLHVHLGNVSFRPGEFEGRDPAGVQKTLNANLYSGVTTVQDLGNDHEHIVALRNAINAGEQLGPRIIASGDNVGGLQSVSSVFEMTGENAQAEIREIIDTRMQADIELIKLYAGMSNWGARHVVNAAKKENMRVIADFWCSNLGVMTFRVTGVDGFAHGSCHEISTEDAEWIAENNKFAMMTLMIFDIMGGHRPYADYSVRGFLEDPLIVDPLGRQTIEEFYAAFPALRESFEDGEMSLYSTQLFGDLKHLLQTNQRNVVTLLEAGVLVGLGTDAAFPPGNWPGEAMHYEMELHADAGIDPIEIIKMATYNGARIIRREDELGSIEKGKVADIFVVRGDPSTSIRDTRNIEFVVKEGKLIDRAALVAD